MREFITRRHREILVTALVTVSLVLIGLGVMLVVLAGTPRTTERSYASAPSAPPVSMSASETTTAAAAPELSPHGASLEAYRGLGSWVDLYETKAWSSPSAAVADMARHGVRTIFIETANAGSDSALVHPTQLAAFIKAAHARGMYIVAWYLPNLRPRSVDYSRAMKAIEFTTADGQKFDSFAMDIESDAVSFASARNRGLAALSAKVRRAAGATYPLGAIIPSPVALSRPNGPWARFPYAAIARTYDVFLPMGYYTFHVHGAQKVYRETRANIRILHAQAGCAASPVHIIGGIASASTGSEVREFVRASSEGGCIGASLYSWSGTAQRAWRQLAHVRATSKP